MKQTKYTKVVIAGKEYTLKVAGEAEVDEFKREARKFKKSPIRYMRELNK